jgi:glycine/D-amino acid oxidase-like deaminating enzyme
VKPAELLTEADWQELVVQYARLQGWWAFHPYDSRKSQAGWPDLVLLRPPELVIVELKSQRGKVTQEQERVLAMLAECGVEAHLWRPADESEVFARLGPRKAALRADPQGEAS